MVIEAIKNDKLHQMERDLYEDIHTTQTQLCLAPSVLCVTPPPPP